jgi:hypothetical protein
MTQLHNAASSLQNICHASHVPLYPHIAICHNSVTTAHIAHLPQQCHNCTYRPFATTVSQLKICDFSGETFKGFEVL